MAVSIAQVRRLALALPEALEAPHFDYTSFRVRGKIFATVPPDDEHLHVFVDGDHREAALARYPESVQKLLWGGKVVGLRLTLSKAKVDVVSDLLRHAWLGKAPKRLAAAATAAEADSRSRSERPERKRSWRRPTSRTTTTRSRRT
jgi:hypothetical protein